MQTTQGETDERYFFQVGIGLNNSSDFVRKSLPTRIDTVQRVKSKVACGQVDDSICYRIP
jgi:hypothetical protein